MPLARKELLQISVSTPDSLTRTVLDHIDHLMADEFFATEHAYRLIISKNHRSFSRHPSQRSQYSQEDYVKKIIGWSVMARLDALLAAFGAKAQPKPVFLVKDVLDMAPDAGGDAGEGVLGVRPRG